MAITKIIEYPDGVIRYTATIDGLGTIRVNVGRYDDGWFAEGEDFDFTHYGDSPDEAMTNFVVEFEDCIAEFGSEKFRKGGGLEIQVPQEIIKCLS